MVAFGDNDISFDCLVEHESCFESFRDHLVEKIALIGVDKQCLQVERKCFYRSDVVVGVAV